jgi:hypothetical protein
VPGDGARRLCTYSSTCGLTPEDEVRSGRRDERGKPIAYFTQTYYWTPRRDRAGSRYALSEPREVTSEPKFEELRERAEIERMLNNKISHPKNAAKKREEGEARIEDFNRRVARSVGRIAYIARRCPELRELYVDSYNQAGRGRQGNPEKC